MTNTKDPQPDNSDSKDWIDDALSGHESLCEDQTQACGDCRRLRAAIEAHIKEAEIKLLKQLRRYYPKKNGRSNDTSKLTRAELDRMIGGRSTLQKENQ